jgi:hypothetical protein
MSTELEIPIVDIVVNTESGERYISDIGDIDVGFGNFLYRLLDGLRDMKPVKSAPFYQYTQREGKKKLYVATETDPKRFVRIVRNRFFHKTDSKQIQSDRSTLPLVYFHRVLGFDQSVTGEEIIEKDVGAIYAEDGTKAAIVDSLPATLNYMVYVLAWDMPTLDKLVAGLTSSLVTSSREFHYPTDVMGHSDDVQAAITPANSLSWTDLSPANTEDRLLVYQGMVEVKARYFQARCITQSTLRFKLTSPVPMYGVNNHGF